MKRIVLSVCAAVAAAVVARADKVTWQPDDAGNWSGDWKSSEHWSSGAEPTEADDVILPTEGAKASYTVTAGAKISAKSLTIGSGSDNGFTATFESQTWDLHEVVGNLLVKGDGAMTHKANTTTSDTPAEEDLFKLRLSVGGDATIASGAVLDVSGKGYPVSYKGPGKGTYQATAASHGGRGGPDGNRAVPTVCYDSIECPTLLGSSGKTSGGGVVRLDITGSFSFDGRISANGTDVYDAYSGAGGSVWISAASVSGSGMIEANGGGTSVSAYSYICGGGGRIAVTTVSANGFAGWTGGIHAYGGGAYSTSTKAGCAGTVYLKEGTQQGVVTVDNGGRSAVDPYGADWLSPGYDSAEFFDSVKLVVTNGGSISVASDTSVKDIYIENGGRAYVLDGGTLSISGSFGNRGTFSQSPSSLVKLIGDADATISPGATTFQHFSCTVPGKTVRFATGAGDLLGIADGGSLTLTGAEGNLLELSPLEPTGTWKIKVPASAEAALAYLSVSNSDASAGRALTAQNSEDRKGNTQWSFPKPISPGDPVVWAENAVDGNWFNPDNWVDRYGEHRAVVETDRVTIPANCVFYPTASDVAITLQSLTVAAGASLTLSGVRLTLTEALAVSGTLTTAGLSRIDCPGDVVISGSYSGPETRFTLFGDADQEVALGGNLLGDFFVEKNVGTVRFKEGFSATYCQMTASATTAFEFQSGANYQFGSFFVMGRAEEDSRTALRASTSASPWNLKVTGVSFCSAVAVSDSDASGGNRVDADAASVGSGNVNWQFGANKRLWVGVSGNFKTAENWLPAGVPDANDDVVIQSLDGNDFVVTADEAIDVKSLTVGSGVSGGGMATFESKTSAPHQIAGDLLVRAGGAMTHAANTTRSDTPAEEDLFKLCFSVGGNATIEDGAVLDASGKGYPANHAGPGKGASNSYGGSHGGRSCPDNGTANPCYGSIERPVMLGSSGLSAGGGVIRLDITGDLSFSGRMSANGNESPSYYTGAGGSIWVSASSIAGSGVIEADGGIIGHSSYPHLGGGGGRIAITSASNGGFAGWTGKAHAYGGALAGKAPGGAFAGTVYQKEGTHQGVVTVDNNGGTIYKQIEEPLSTDWPSADYDTDEFLGSVKLVVTNGGCVGMVADAPVGDVLIENKGRFVMFDKTLGVHGSFENAGTLKASSGKVELVGPAEATVAGALTFGQFSCTVPGKTVRFATGAGDLLGIADGGSLTLTGAEGSLLSLSPLEPTGTWKIKVPASAEAALAYLSVSNSDASAGRALTAQNSEDRKGNTQWSFPKPISPGDPMIWSENAVDGNWFNPDNWVDRYGEHRAVLETDCVTIPANCVFYPTASDVAITLQSLTIAEGASLTLSGVRLTLTATLSAALSVSGTLTAEGLSRIDCPGDVVISGSYSGPETRFALSGDANQTVALGGNQLGNFFVEKNGGTVSFTDGFSATYCQMTASATTAFEFQSGANYQFGSFFVIGSAEAGSRTALRASTSASPWNLKVTGATFCSAVAVSDSDASGGNRVDADADSVGSDDRNVNWQFGAHKRLWIGTSGNFKTAEKWLPTGVPEASDDVVIQSLDGNDLVVTADEAIDVKSLTVGSGVSGGGTATFESKTSALHQIAGDLLVRAGGAMTHTANTETSDTPAEEDLFKLCFSVGGNATIESGVVLDVSGKGYPASCRGPGKGTLGAVGASHGGRGGPDGNKAVPTVCYDSIECPTMLGSSCKTSGGGVVRLDITGSFSFDGRISANGTDVVSDTYSGAGGSVWISAASVSGSGMIEANGGGTSISAWAYACGGGGRIAVTTVSANGFAGWTGGIHAYGGGAYSTSTKAGGPGTVYLKAGTAAGVVIVDNNGKSSTAPYGADFPSQKYDTKKFLESVNLVVSNGATVALTGSQKINDINLAESKAVLNLHQYTLTVMSGAHKRGRNWAKDATVTAETVEGVTGEIVWPSGLVITIK